MRKSTTSDFYLACCSGDVDTIKQINSIESNGCSTTTMNSDGKTALEEYEDKLIKSSTIGLNNHTSVRSIKTSTFKTRLR
jgi:hypothetical protein